MRRLTAQVIVDILKQEMCLADDAVWVRNQNVLIPNDTGLYIIVGMRESYPIANVTKMTTVQNGNDVDAYQVCEITQREIIQIDIVSRSNAALLRNWEVTAALQSFYSQQQQELNNFKIFRIPRSFVDSSESEGPAQLNKYSISIACFVWYRKTTQLTSPLGDYYDDFTTRVDDENTIGTDTPLLEFEINSTGVHS